MSSARGQLRIIGGRWRSRHVGFPDLPGLRPTPDRVRQTLFDWLSPRIEGARCLDLFAGSGALGLEALSRGATQVQFVEQDALALRALRENLVQLGATERADCTQADALRWLAQPSAEIFDVVFLDPPYAASLLLPALHALRPRLKPESRVYLEWPKESPITLPAGYAWLREKQAGRVSFGLITGTPGDIA